MPQDFASWEERHNWMEAEKAAMLREERRPSRWAWPLQEGTKPLDDLFGSPANLRVLRVLWGEPRAWWPGQIARRARLSSSTVHAALTRLHTCRVVERVSAWGASRSFAYRLARRNPIVKELERLFHLEAGMIGGW